MNEKLVVLMNGGFTAFFPLIWVGNAIESVLNGAVKVVERDVSLKGTRVLCTCTYGR